MAILEIQPHWITELVRRKQGKSVSSTRLVVCDGCVQEGLQGQLHGTLDRVGDTHVYLCEVHQIMAGRKAPTLQFRQALEKAQRQQKEQENAERAAGVSIR